VATTLGCRPLPKPDELVALEKLRKRQDRQDLAKQSDEEYQRAVAAWRDKDLRTARYFALVGAIKLRMASTEGPEKELRGRVEKLWGKLNKAQAEHAQIKDKLAQINEMVQLYEELAVAQSSALEKKLHVSEVQQVARAEKQLGQARLALKMAELVSGERYARKLVTMARTLVERAETEFNGKEYTKAFATAELASQKAQEAYEASQPHYQKERAAAGRHAQNQALQKELVSLASTSRWLSVKLVARGGSQWLVIPVMSLFHPLGTAPVETRSEMLDQIAGRLKRFPEFHVVVRGHTSHRSPPAKRRRISRLRARKVADYLIGTGLDAKRFLVRGHGASRLVAYKRSTLNDRVEIWILLR
jgi:outer membrane protein OmpA-like peptidoglycan-associated protein